MDTSRISFGEMVAGVSGLLLLLFMFVGWYGVEDAPGSANAWESFSFIDILLLLVALVAIGLPALRAGGNMPAGLPAPPGLIVAAAGAFAVLLILIRLVFPPDFSAFGFEVDTTRKVGIFLALLAAAGVTFGGYTASSERTAGTEPPPGRPPGGTPPGGAPPGGAAGRREG